MDDDREQGMLRSVALQNAQSILAARLRAEQALRETQQQLEESRQLLQTALLAAGSGVFRWQLGSEVFFLDENSRALLSLANDQLTITMSELADRVVAPVRERFLEHLRRMSREGGELDIEFQLTGAGNHGRWLETRGTQLRDPRGDSGWFVGTFTDISNRKRSEAVLRENSELLRSTFQRAAVGIATASLSGHMLEVNDKFVEILGYSREQLAKMTFRDFTHSDDLARTDEQVRRLLAGEISEYAMDKRYRRADGATVWSHTTVSLLTDARGKPRGFVAAVNDITQRKRAESALEEETRMLEVLNRTNAALVADLDLQSLVQSVTDAATQLSGARFGAFFYNTTDSDGAAMQLHTLSGAPRSAFDHFGHPRPTAVFGPTFRAEGIVRSDDIHLDPRYGKSAPHFGLPAGHPPVRSYLAVPVKSRSEEVIGGLFFGHPEPGIFTERAERIVAGIAAQAAIAIDNARLYEDVRRGSAERDRLLEAERTARAMAERAGLMKDEFLATLSHELRTPLNAVLGWSQILLAKHSDEETLRRGAETIARNAKVQAKLIDDLLDMTRIVSGKVRLDVQPVWLDAVLDAAMDALRPSAEARGVSLQKRIDPSAGPVSGDPTRLQQVIWNLLSNAIKFTGRGGSVVVRVARVDSHLEVSVTDNGSGIAPEFLPFVFDRFRQADSSATRSVGGLGLGLAIVKQLVELHGGHVSAYSQGDGKGTTMLIKLPMAPVLSEPCLPERADDGMRLMESLAIDLSGIRALIVDDEPDASAMVGVVLSQNHASVATAASADEALRMLDCDRFDVLLSDIGMPGKDGYQLIRELRSRAPDRGGAIPAVALTAFARSEDRARAMLAGYQMHLAKPVEPWELVATVGSLLGRFGAR